ncbi:MULTISPECIES: helix-turn-helix transcriptional regulator [Streptomyces]|uniref:Response regulator transcription factor n=3 Tax=Streptomyces TaxID=1883 RepID=A0ABD5J3Z1_9ACTN|nr:MULTISPECIES: response regulator transcription factor [Streptomyces]MEE4582946.1 response regulator transcription factor [Streptomyces sp. DSM 41602]QTI90046.1 response regulator transcription factor [Streptomyces sp. AgN23]WTB03484.1 response regulator transcription factor [Streptomyces antimycoticus]KUL65302.1 LuxR family transcriptional regulator [Streptomyces violaceusniger]RSS41242.1 DNA-binding response regulator [Streptomyces sp. WAC05858]
MNQTTGERVTVALRAQDPVSRAGVASQLRTRPEVKVIDWDEPDSPQVVVVVLDVLDDGALRVLRQIQRTSAARGVLVTTQIDEQQLVNAAECGFVGVVRRAEATPERLVQVIAAVAKGEGRVPPDLLGSLLEQVGRLQGQVLAPNGLNFTGLATREIEVLRLVAEGYDTADIAMKLSYSERTIKNVLHAVMTRLNLRNRSHAVAYALRQGLI